MADIVSTVLADNIWDGTANQCSKALTRTSDGRYHCLMTGDINGGTYRILHHISTNQGESWSPINTIGGDYHAPSITVDSADNIHMVYKNQDDSSLCYRKYNGTTWGTETTLNADYGNTAPDICVDSADHIHVAFNKSANKHISYIKYDTSWNAAEDIYLFASWPKTFCILADSDDHLHYFCEHAGAQWFKKTTTWDAAPTKISNSTSVEMGGGVVDKSGDIHVVWRDLGATDDEIEYRKYADGSWNAETTIAAEAGEDQIQPSIGVDYQDNVYVVWVGEYSGSPSFRQIRYRKYDTSWNATVNMTTADADHAFPNALRQGYSPSYGSSGIPNLNPNTPAEGFAFVYTDAVTGSSANAIFTALDGTIYTRPNISTVATGVNGEATAHGEDRSLVRDAVTGRYYCTYVKTTDSKKNVMLGQSADNGCVWSESTITADDTNDNYQPVMALDSSSILHLAWTKGSNIVYAAWTDSIGSITTISAGDFPSIAVDSNDYLHLAYVNGASDYAYKKYTTSWGAETTIHSDNDVYFGELIVDSNDNLHVGYSRTDVTAAYTAVAYKKYTTSWSSETVIDGPGVSSSTIIAYNSLAVDTNDYIHFVWRNYGHLDTGYNIFYKKYTTSWSGITTIDSEIWSKENDRPVVTTDKNNNVYVLWQGTDVAMANTEIKYRKYNGSSWEAETDITSDAYDTGNQAEPTAMFASVNSWPKTGFVCAWTCGASTDVKIYASEDLHWDTQYTFLSEATTLTDTPVLHSPNARVTISESCSLTALAGRAWGEEYSDSITLNDNIGNRPIIIPASGYAVLLNNIEWVDWNTISYEDPAISLTDVPEFQLTTDNVSGRHTDMFNTGDDIKIYRNRNLVFYGEVEDRTFKKASSGTVCTIAGPHKGYKALKDHVCDYYRAQNIYYAPAVNPWQYGRKVDDSQALVDGLRPDEIMECLLGTKFVWQEWCLNHDYFKWAAPNLTLYEHQDDYTTPFTVAYGGFQSAGQTFTVGNVGSNVPFVLSKVSFVGIKIYSGFTITAKLYATDVDGKPTGSVLSTGTISTSQLGNDTPDWYDIDMSYYQLAASTRYHIHFSCDDFFYIYYQNTDAYSGGNMWHYVNFGTWYEHPTRDLAFKIYGYQPSTQLVVYDNALKLPAKSTTVDAGLETTGFIQSIGLYNGDKNVDAMGDITTVDVKAIGVIDSSTNNPDIYVCRNADSAAPTWQQVSLDYGAGVWTGSSTFSGGETTKNQFGYYVYLAGNGSETTELNYFRFDCATASDTAIQAGTIQPYNDPNTDDDTIAINLIGLTRLEALEKVREFTNTSTAYADINWDAYIDNDLQFHFTTIRGEDIDKTFSFNNKNLTLLDRKLEGEIKNTIIAIGQGEEPYAVTIVGTEMTDFDSIETYGQRTGYFIDKSIPDAPTLYKRAKTYLEYMKDPRETLAVQLTNDPVLSWNVGDRIQLQDTELNVNGYYRVLSKKISVKRDSPEKIDITLGTKSHTVGELFHSIQEQFATQATVSQGASSKTNTVAWGINYDKDHPAAYKFYVPENTQRVSVSVQTSQFQDFSIAAGITEFTYYPEKTNLKIDSTSVAPSTKFGYLGIESASATVIDLDITADLQDVNRKIITGQHTLYFTPVASTNNTLGLGRIFVTHLLTISTAENTDLEPLPM